MNWSRVGEFSNVGQFEDDIRGSARVSAMGLVAGPMSHLWYRFLESRIAGPISARLVAKKVLCDISVAPAFSATFITGRPRLLVPT